MTVNRYPGPDMILVDRDLETGIVTVTVSRVFDTDCDLLDFQLEERFATLKDAIASLAWAEVAGWVSR